MSNPKWPNKKIPASNDEIDVVGAEVISSLQIAALNETTDRSTSKPKAVIDGQDATGGGGTTTPHALGTNVDTTTGPFLSQHVDNITKFTNLYNNNTAKFPAYSTVEKFLSAVLGQPLAESIDVSCVYVPNANNDQTAGVWTWSDVVQWKNFGIGDTEFTDQWFIPEGLFIKILETNDASLNSMAAFKALSPLAQRNMASDTSLMNPFLPTALQDTYAIKNLNASPEMNGGNRFFKGSEKIAGTTGNPGEFDGTNDNLWWTTIEEFVRTMASTDTTLRLSPDAPCIGGGHDKTVGWKIETTTITTHGTPMVVADDKIEVDSSVLDPENLPADPQFIIDVPWDPVLLSNLATIFADPDDYTLLTGDIKVEVLKAAVSTAAGSDAPPSIVTYADQRPVELDGSGNPTENQYDEESVIPAINRIHTKTNQALGSAGFLDQFLTNAVIGNPGSSVNVGPGDATYDALTAKGYFADATIALGRLNLIPILSGDRLIESVPKLDSDGNRVYTDTGQPETVYITQKQRAEMTPEARRERFMVHPDSDVPPTYMLEALWTNWRHLSALTTDTYGISALTDVDILGDKHKLLEPMELNSFIQNFNLLYNRTSSLSADLGPIKRALSGDAPGDTLISELSSHSIYHNLNTIYTGMSANSACCETNSLSTVNNRTDINNLSAFVIDLEGKIGSGGVSTCEGQDLCTALTNLHDTIVNLDNPGGFVLCYPSQSLEKHFKPDLNWQDTTDCVNVVKPESDVYRYHQEQSGPDMVLHLWQATNNNWWITPGDPVTGEFTCNTSVPGSQQILNPDNLPLEQLTHNGCSFSPQPSPYPEFTTKINKITDFINNMPVSIPGYTELSACCDTNTLNLSALSAYVYGSPVEQLAGALKKANGDPPNGLTDVVNILFNRIVTLEETGGGGGDSEQVIINKLNISILSGGLSSLSGDVYNLSGDVIENAADIININNQITTISGDIDELEKCCDSSVKIDDLGMHAVLLTGAQSVSGEKTFRDTLTVDQTAKVGELLQVGEGETLFSVCSADDGNSYVQIHSIMVDPSEETLPDGAIYAKSVQGADGLFRKQLYIK